MIKQAIGTLAVSLMAFSPPVLSQDLYLDGGLGTAEAEAGGAEGDDTYLRLGLGFRQSDTVAFEGGYWDLGEAEDGGASVSADGFYGAVKGTFDSGGDIDVFGRFGLYLWDAEACASGLGCADDDGSDIFFGGGIAFPAGPGDLNLELHTMELDDVDVTTIGASFNLPLEQ